MPLADSPARAQAEFRETAVNADDLQRAVTSARSVMASVRPEHMGNPTPCGSWTVRDLLIHMIDAPAFSAVVMETGDSTTYSAAPANPVAGDCVAEYDTTTSRAIAAFRADGAMSKLVTLPVVGALPGADFVVLATCDALVHGWDLARATGLPANFDAELAADVLEAVRPLVSEQMRSADGTALFDPEVEVPSDAAPMDRLAGFLGRRP
jgi:uncharacterized protein (TIGR03086 family)